MMDETEERERRGGFKQEMLADNVDVSCNAKPGVVESRRWTLSPAVGRGT